MTLKYITFLAVVLLIEYPIYTNHLHEVLSDCSFIAQDVPLLTRQPEAAIINKECKTWPQTDQAIQEHLKRQSHRDENSCFYTNSPSLRKQYKEDGLSECVVK